MSPTNLAAEIEARASGEPIEAIAIGTRGGWPDEEHPAPAHAGQILTWEQARPLLDWTFDNFGWDGPRAWNLIAWTASWVIFTHEYDTATTIAHLPRNPVGYIGSTVGSM